ncbi:MAG: rhodanese-like domain-containing protein [Ectothiorhodospira sp.]
MQRLPPRALRNHLDRAPARPILLDVREPWEYEIVHLPGSQLCPMDRLPERAKTLDPRAEIVLICHHGIRSRQAGLWLEHLGFSRLINLEGGIDAWAREVDPSLPVYG